MPVECMDALGLQPGFVVVDATVGGGGHAELILERIAPTGRLIGLDWDDRALERAAQRLGDRATLVRSDYRQLPEVLDGLGIDRVDAVLIDMGVSMDQLDDAARGLSFRYDAPIDMRLRSDIEETAAQMLARMSAAEIEAILSLYGEERHAGRIARRIAERVKQGQMNTTMDLMSAVEEAKPRRKGYQRIHPATQTMMAVRIALNRELEELPKAIENIFERIRPGGRLVTLSFHSLEDRPVKQTMRRLADAGRGRLLYKKPLRPTPAEAAENPASRSAKLRAIEKA